MIGVGVLGVGFIGRVHAGCYQRAADAGLDCRVVAIADRKPENLDTSRIVGGNLGDPAACDLRGATPYPDVDELLADSRVELVSICTPTDTHVDLAIRALAAGKHVLVEKPVAVASADAARLVAAAQGSARLCMPAFCMRFWPGWEWLRARVVDGRFGAVRSAVFARLGCPPAWAPDFYRDTTRSGGALVDLHIHDADFVRWCFGEPDSVASTGSTDHITTLYRYSRGPSHVVAEGGWDHTPGFPFRMRFTVAFERATAEFDSQRPAPLLLAQEGRSTPVAIAAHTGWDGEIRALLAAIRDGAARPPALIEDAQAVAALLEREHESLTTGAAVGV